MALAQFINNCSAQAIAFPTIFGAEFMSVQASLAQNYSLSPLIRNPRRFRDEEWGRNMTFCNVTLKHTHPGQNDTTISQVLLPIEPKWNGRLKMVGGGGWQAGLTLYTDQSMSLAVADGYATVTTDGSVPPTGPDDWALLSPGNLNTLAVQNWAYVSLKDAALAAKSVISGFFGRPTEFSYFEGCSQGGRQGLMFAQRYPDIFNGIQAAAPVINTKWTWASYFPQQVMNEMDEYPHTCEIDALTNLAIKECDAQDGLRDGIISDEDACSFDPYTVVGRSLNCSSPSAPKTISKAAAIVADAAWNGAWRADGTFIWPTMGHQTNLTQPGGLARTICADNGTCTRDVNVLLSTSIRLIGRKDPDFDVSSMSRREYEKTLHAAIMESDGSVGTKSPDLYEFNYAGGKMLTWHGLVRKVVAFCVP
jgi:hypothetical protein